MRPTSAHLHASSEETTLAAAAVFEHFANETTTRKTILSKLEALNRRAVPNAISIDIFWGMFTLTAPTVNFKSVYRNREKIREIVGLSVGLCVSGLSVYLLGYEYTCFLIPVMAGEMFGGMLTSGFAGTGRLCSFGQGVLIACSFLDGRSGVEMIFAI